MESNASVFKYQEYLDGKGGSRPLDHLARRRLIRRHRPRRPDELVDLWSEWVACHGGDVQAALGGLLTALVDAGHVHVDERRPT